MKNDTLNKKTMFGNGERDYSVDLMRSISCLMVVAGHMSGFLISWCMRSDTIAITDQWLGVTTIRCLAVSATNLFLMISGIFFLSPERNVSISKIWSKNILKLAMAYVVWSMIYALLRIFYTNPQPFSVETFIHETITQEFHLWYIPMMLGIYVLVPIMRLFTINAERKHYIYVIWLMVAAITLNTVKTFNGIFDFPFATSVNTIIDYTPTALICQYPFYCILGYYLYTYKPKFKTRIVIYGLGVLGVVFLVFSSIVAYCKTGDPCSNDLLDKFTIGVLAKNTALFVFIITFFSSVNFSSKCKKILSKISAATLFIYLSHVVLMYVFFHEGWLIGEGNNLVITCCIYTITIYCAGFVFSYIFLQSIPWTKWRNVVLDAVWPNRKIWNGGRKKVKKNAEH